MQFEGETPNEMQFLNVVTLTNSDCRARLGPSNAALVHDSTLCVYAGGRERGLCHGDSGGPLVSDGVLIGAVSWGEPCATGRPDGFTRISSFLPWIFGHIIEGIQTTTPAPATTSTSPDGTYEA